MLTGVAIVATEFAAAAIDGVVAANGIGKWIAASTADNFGAIAIIFVFGVRFGLISFVLNKSSEPKEEGIFNKQNMHDQPLPFLEIQNA